MYETKEECYRDLQVAREAFGSMKTGPAQWDQLEKTLGIMYLNCPESVQTLVWATIEEASRRRFLLESSGRLEVL